MADRLLLEDGSGYLLTEDGGAFLTEASAPSEATTFCDYDFAGDTYDNAADTYDCSGEPSTGPQDWFPGPLLTSTPTTDDGDLLLAVAVLRSRLRL